MADANTPPMAWFAPPEGVYTLTASLNVLAATNSATTPMSPGGNPATPVIGSPSGPGQAGLHSESTATPPPIYNTKFSLVSVRFPVKESASSGLGMSMGSLRGASRGNINAGEASASGLPPPVPLAGSSGSAHPAAELGPASSTNGSDTTKAPQMSLPMSISGSNGGPTSQGLVSPALKRKPLAGTFSITNLSSLSSGGNQSSGGSNDGASTSSGSRPLRHFRGTSSSFVRSWEGLPISQPQLRGIAESNAGKDTLFTFYTSGKSIVWAEIGMGRPKDALCRITFSTAPTCTDVNQKTASSQQLDVLVGFSNGDIFWFDPLSAKYTRLNKGGIISSSPITTIRWLPAPSPSLTGPSSTENHSNLFLTSHADGTVIVWDKDREDWSGFVPTPPTPGPSLVQSPMLNGKENLEANANVNTARVNGKEKFRTHAYSSNQKDAPLGPADLSNGLNDIIVTRPQTLDKKGEKTTKFNPVSHWKLSKTSINTFAFSPDLQYCATVGNDGCLRIIETASERLLDTFAGYFGALICVAWSPDGRFLLTGGQDDLCTVYSPHEQRLIARCQGHSSWVTGVAWDPWRSDDRTQRFASVGEDCKLILWDLSSAALTRPKVHAQIPRNRRVSTGASTLSLSHRRRPTGESSFHLPIASASNSDASAAERLGAGPVFHPSPQRSEVSLLQPIMVKTLSTDLFADLIFLPQYLVTLSRSGQIKQWDRPPTEEEGGSGLQNLRNEFIASVVIIDTRNR